MFFFPQVEATDNDLEENALLTYSIYHISNNGRGKFKIDPRSGLITTSGKLNAGDQYSITVQVRELFIAFLYNYHGFGYELR